MCMMLDHQVFLKHRINQTFCSVHKYGVVHHCRQYGAVLHFKMKQERLKHDKKTINSPQIMNSILYLLNIGAKKKKKKIENQGSEF